MLEKAYKQFNQKLYKSISLSVYMYINHLRSWQIPTGYRYAEKAKDPPKDTHGES